MQMLKLASRSREKTNLVLGVGVGSLLPAEGGNDVDEPPVVLDTSLGTAGLLFLLLAGLNFWGLSANLTSTSQGSVNLSSEEWDCNIDGMVLEKGYGQVLSFEVEGLSGDVEQDILALLDG